MGLTGVVTLQYVHQAINHDTIEQEAAIPIFFAKKDYSTEFTRQLIPFDLTNSLITKCFTSNISKTQYYLDHWFVADPDLKSMFQPKEWLTLFLKLARSMISQDFSQAVK